MATSLKVFDGGGISSASLGTSNGGNVLVDAGSRLGLLSGGFVSASSAQGRGGDVTISSGQSILLDTGSVDTKAAKDGGNIRLAAPAAIELRNGSQIASNSGTTGGNIAIDPVELTLLGNSAIHADAVMHGGRITLRADQQTGVVTKGASANVTAKGGIVPGAIVATPEQLDIVGSLVLLQTGLATPVILVPQCAVQFGDQSSFVISGRGGARRSRGAGCRRWSWICGREWIGRDYSPQRRGAGCARNPRHEARTGTKGRK